VWGGKKTYRNMMFKEYSNLGAEKKKKHDVWYGDGLCGGK